MAPTHPLGARGFGVLGAGCFVDFKVTLRSLVQPYADHRPQTHSDQPRHPEESIHMCKALREETLECSMRRQYRKSVNAYSDEEDRTEHNDVFDRLHEDDFVYKQFASRARKT